MIGFIPRGRLAVVLASSICAVVGCSSNGDVSRNGSLSDGSVDQGRADHPSSSGGASDSGQEHPANCVPTGPEMCDGKDDNCDGIIDDGFTWQGTPVGSHCYPGTGACLVTGTVVCASLSTATCSASPGSPDETFHTTAAPNGSWDWNCNNSVDRQYPLASCESFTSATCPAQGYSPVTGQSGDCGQMLVQQACVASGAGCTSSGPTTSVTEACK
jgi:hypothetical protein